jgi:N-acetylglucosaminyl-diphospho-decaprenol L-rhamnosyltransferase
MGPHRKKTLNLEQGMTLANPIQLIPHERASGRPSTRAQPAGRTEASGANTAASGPRTACALTVLIVTYNSRRLIGNLLEQLQPQLAGLEAEVLVVDNASHDGTADLVAADYPWVKLVRSRENLGFAAGNNLGARHAGGRMLLMLNPDAVPEPGAIAEGLQLMRANPRVGLGGGRLLDTDGRTQPSARMFPTLFQEFAVLTGLAARYPQSRIWGHFDRTWADPAQAAQIDWVPGAFAFMSAELFQRIGGFDERFFLYYEEVDLCRRIQQRGFTIHYWPQLRVQHIGGESAKTVEGQKVSKTGTQLTLWRARSGLLYYRKNHGLLTAWAANRLERSWHALRAWKARRAGLLDKAEESAAICTVLARAWDETRGGRVSPPRPW